MTTLAERRAYVTAFPGYWQVKVMDGPCHVATRRTATRRAALKVARKFGTP